MEEPKKDEPPPIDTKTESKQPVLSPREAAAIFGNLQLPGLNQRKRYPNSRM
jgi:hypothetical protein